MGLLSWLGIGGVEKTVGAVGGVLDNLFTSDEERMEAKRLQSIIDDKPHQDQRTIGAALVNKAGAMSWHNALGWVIAVSIGFYFIPQYATGAFVWIKACSNAGWSDLPPYPIDANGLLELVIAMLGLAGKVTVERIAKVRPAARP
jgi:hypothetical protein